MTTTHECNTCGELYEGDDDGQGSHDCYGHEALIHTLTLERKELHRALERYGKHDLRCKIRRPETCDCGWTEIRRALLEGCYEPGCDDGEIFLGPDDEHRGPCPRCRPRRAAEKKKWGLIEGMRVVVRGTGEHHVAIDIIMGEEIVETHGPFEFFPDLRITIGTDKEKWAREELLPAWLAHEFEKGEEE